MTERRGERVRRIGTSEKKKRNKSPVGKGVGEGGAISGEKNEETEAGKGESGVGRRRNVK